jgi:putative acetyltransferase
MYALKKILSMGPGSRFARACPRTTRPGHDEFALHPAPLSRFRRGWRGELVPNAAVIVAEQQDRLQGFVTIDQQGYLDQLVVAPDHWGSELATMLVDEAKRLSPGSITLLVNTDNARAIRFYERNGFVHKGEDVNPVSGRPVKKMEWTAKAS